MAWHQCLRAGTFLVALATVGGPAAPEEVSRVQRQLRGAETVLAGRDLSGLSPAQRANRQTAIRLLAGYRRAGRFPQNEHFRDQRMPYFRDRHGNLCAMAFLLEQTGSGPIVEHVARTRNNDFVPELADEPGLAEWLDRFGITLVEAARIQPGYGFPPEGGFTDPERLTTGYAVASLLGIGLSATGATLNLTAPRSRHRAAWLAAGAGFVTAMLGAGKLKNGGDVRKVAVADVVVGGIATLIGLNGLFDRGVDSKIEPHARGRLLDLGITVGPGGAPGIVARLRF